MAQSTSIGQSLALQNQLDQVQLKIDQITGQIRYLNNQVAESTIKVDIHEPDAAVANTTNDDIRNPSLGRAFERAVQGFMNILAAVVIGLRLPDPAARDRAASSTWGWRRCGGGAAAPPTAAKPWARWRGGATPTLATAPR